MQAPRASIAATGEQGARRPTPPRRMASAVRTNGRKWRFWDCGADATRWRDACALRHAVRLLRTVAPRWPL